MQGGSNTIRLPFFSDEQLEAVDSTRRPTHIAIIPDGNRRWADKRQMEAVAGHRQGADVLMNIVQAAKELSIRMLTIYGFSIENWQRPRGEVDAVLWLIETYLREERPRMVKDGVRILSLGDTAGLPVSLQETLRESERATQHCNGITLALALNYSGRSELCRAFKRLVADSNAGKLGGQDIDEALLSRYLDTQGYPDPDLLIRPGGEQRLSNFLLWQLSYTELYFSPKLWPDFAPEDLYDAVLSFQSRHRRLGA